MATIKLSPAQEKTLKSLWTGLQPRFADQRSLKSLQNNGWVTCTFSSRQATFTDKAKVYARAHFPALVFGMADLDILRDVANGSLTPENNEMDDLPEFVVLRNAKYVLIPQAQDYLDTAVEPALDETVDELPKEPAPVTATLEDDLPRDANGFVIYNSTPKTALQIKFDNSLMNWQTSSYVVVKDADGQYIDSVENVKRKRWEGTHSGELICATTSLVQAHQWLQEYEASLSPEPLPVQTELTACQLMIVLNNPDAPSIQLAARLYNLYGAKSACWALAQIKALRGQQAGSSWKYGEKPYLEHA